MRDKKTVYEHIGANIVQMAMHKDETPVMDVAREYLAILSGSEENANHLIEDDWTLIEVTFDQVEEELSRRLREVLHTSVFEEMKIIEDFENYTTIYQPWCDIVKNFKMAVVDSHRSAILSSVGEVYNYEQIDVCINSFKILLDKCF